MSPKKTLSGLFWNGAESFFLQLIQLLVSMVLARLLTAVDFGLIALISVFIAVADTIVQGGFRATIIMRPNLQKIDFSTAFVYNLVVAVLLYVAMFFSAPLIASFYDEPRLVLLVRVLGLVNIIHAGYFVQDALLQKDMRFKLLAQRNIFAALISGGIAITMALFGYGVWSLVCLTLARAVAINIFLWLKSVWKLSLDFSWKSFKQNFAFGSRMMLTNITGVIFANLNNLLIGKFYTKADLGYYYQARKLKTVPIDSACGVLTKTSTPLLSQDQNDLQELHRTYFHITRIAALILIPVSMLLFVFSRDLIVTMFGQKWEASVPIFRIIVLIGLFQPFIIINGQASAIMGDSRFYLKFDTALKLFTLLVSFIALRFSLLIFIASQTAVVFVQMILNLFIARKYFRVGIRDQMRVYAPYFAYSAIAGLSSSVFGLIPGLPSIIILFAGVGIFTAVFCTLVYIFERKTFDDVLKLARAGIEKMKGWGDKVTG